MRYSLAEKGKTMDNLSKCAKLAKKAGMSYGQWMALHGSKPKKKKAESLPEGWRRCEECGKPFRGKSGQRFCEISCRNSAYLRKDAKRRRDYMRKWRAERKDKDESCS